MPLPEVYSASRGGSVASAKSGVPMTLTGAENRTSMSMAPPWRYAPSASVETPVAYAADDDESIAIPRMWPSEPSSPGSGRARVAAYPGAQSTSSMRPPGEPASRAVAFAYSRPSVLSPGCTLYTNSSRRVPLPDTYSALRFSPSSASSRVGGGPSTFTGLSKATVIGTG